MLEVFLWATCGILGTLLFYKAKPEEDVIELHFVLLFIGLGPLGIIVAGGIFLLTWLYNNNYLPLKNPFRRR
jgi:hypothetical protein